MSSYDNGVKQPIFSIIAKNANEDQKEAFVETIETTLARLAAEGLDEKLCGQASTILNSVTGRLISEIILPA